MDLKECRNTVRRRLDDKAPPYLWANEELDEYINEAQREAAERARLIYDETSTLATLAIKAGTSKYTLDPLILAVDRIKLVSTGDVLTRRTREWLDENCPGWESREGTPSAFVEREGYLLLTPTPRVDDTAAVSLWRLPVEVLKEPCDKPEIPDRHHMRMLDWAIHLAYLKRDSDTYDADKATVYEDKFERSFGFRPDANVQRKQRLRNPPVVRSSW